MEFLDLESKRQRTIRLFVGYFLLTIVIGLATWLLIYMAQGYNYNIDKGVTQNGLVFIDSKPVAANVFIDGLPKNKTDAKVSLAEGRHQIVLKQTNYRDWSKSFTVEGGSVLYFLYPKLIPTNIAVGVTKVFNDAPAWVSQSPDRRWLILQQNATSPVLTIIDLTKPDEEPVLSTLPASQMISVDEQFGTLSPIEWSEDNKHLLILQQLPDGNSAYLIFDRENADLSLNLTTTLNLTGVSKISLRDKKYDKFFIHDQILKKLSIASLKDGVEQDSALSGVIAYKSYAGNLIMYVSYDAAAANEAKVFVVKNLSEKYLLQSVTRDGNNKYLLDLTEFQNNWYYVVAAKTGNSIKLFRNPLKRSKANNKTPIAPQMSLELATPQAVSFSNNARFIAMQSGKNFVVFDAEQNRIFRYTSNLDIKDNQIAKWMDGHRLCVVVDGKIRIFEFDNTNGQELINSRPEFTAYFDKDYKYVYALVQQADGKTGFESGKLFAN